MMTKFPPIGRSIWFETLIGQHIQTVVSALPANIVESAKQQGQNQDPWEEAEKVLAYLCNDDQGTL
jgi:hypothetical protein